MNDFVKNYGILIDCEEKYGIVPRTCYIVQKKTVIMNLRSHNFDNPAVASNNDSIVPIMIKINMIFPLKIIKIRTILVQRKCCAT